ncbi:MAG: response regulator [Crocosphaera sp.]
MPARLLVVEDEPDIEQIFKGKYWKEIKEGKYEFIFVNNGEKALEVIEKQGNIDLIITDLKMPNTGMDGSELIKQLRKKHINTKIIVFSAYRKEYDFTNKEKKNIVFFLDKDSGQGDFKELTSLVESSLSNSSLTALKNLVDVSLDFPEHLDPKSQRVRLDTLMKIIKEFPSSKQQRLFSGLVKYLPYRTLEWLKNEFVQEVNKALDQAYRHEELRQWLLQKQSEHKIRKEIPLDKIEYFFIEIRTDLANSTYYYMYWPENGSWKQSYLTKSVMEQELPEYLKHYIQEKAKKN